MLYSRLMRASTRAWILFSFSLRFDDALHLGQERLAFLAA